MVSYSLYESDNRVRRYAESLVERGDQVDVIALSSESTSDSIGKLNGVTTHYIQHRGIAERGKWIYSWRCLRFLFFSLLRLAALHRKNKYDLIHVHNMPDILVFSALYPKWTGASTILDIHDIMPELYDSKFGKSKPGLANRVLRVLERLSAAFADHVIVSNHLWYQRLVDRSVPQRKCSVFINHVDRGVFYSRPRTRSDGKFIILFPGTFQWHQGLDLAVEAMALVKERVPAVELHLYGDGDAKQSLVQMVDRLKLQANVKFFQGRCLNEIADVVANADLGVVPKRSNSFGNEAYSTKIMEFMSQGVPVVASRTRIDSFYFDESVITFFEPGNSRSLAETILDLIEHPSRRETLIRNSLAYVQRNDWATKKDEYWALVDRLMEQHSHA